MPRKCSLTSAVSTFAPSTLRLLATIMRGFLQQSSKSRSRGLTRA